MDENMGRWSSIYFYLPVLQKEIKFAISMTTMDDLLANLRNRTTFNLVDLRKAPSDTTSLARRTKYNKETFKAKDETAKHEGIKAFQKAYREKTNYDKNLAEDLTTITLRRTSDTSEHKKVLLLVFREKLSKIRKKIFDLSKQIQEEKDKKIPDKVVIRRLEKNIKDAEDEKTTMVKEAVAFGKKVLTEDEITKRRDFKNEMLEDVEKRKSKEKTIGDLYKEARAITSLTERKAMLEKLASKV